MALIEINTNPSARDLRWFGVLFAAFFGLIGGIVLWRFGASSVAGTLWAVGGVGAILYYAVPPLRRPMFVGWMYAAYPIGWVVSHVLLAAIYFLVVTPIGIIMRLVGRDPMERKFDPAATTYWVEHDPGKDTERYFRQF